MLLEWFLLNIGLLIPMVLLLSCLAYFLCYALVANLRRWISERRMEKKGFERSLVCHEDECPWVKDYEDAMPDVDGGFRKKEVRQAKRKRLDTGTEKALDSPSKEELDRLKENLGIASGCICFKHGAIYVVTCEGKKRRWKRLGRWETLRQNVAK